jgi:hypothetical protein
MRLPLRHLSLRRSLIALTAVALLAVVAAVAFRHDDTSAARAREPLARVVPPGHGWVAGGAGLDPGWEQDTIERDSQGVWTGLDPQASAVRYLVTWQFDVGSGDGEAACAQVAAWLARTGPSFPGHPDGLVEDVTVPSGPEVLGRCRRVLALNAPGQMIDETFAMWQPSRRFAGFEYHAYAAFHGDHDHRMLVVTALAQQIES